VKVGKVGRLEAAEKVSFDDVREVLTAAEEKLGRGNLD